jgi:hypothetical protein
MFLPVLNCHVRHPNVPLLAGSRTTAFQYLGAKTRHSASGQKGNHYGWTNGASSPLSIVVR